MSGDVALGFAQASQFATLIATAIGVLLGLIVGMIPGMTISSGIIILLPMRTPQLAVLFIGFGLGLLTDMFYDSPGVHASASVATAFLRPWVLGQLEPREGYQLNVGPTRQRFGFPWFSQYAAILLAFHLLVYFTVETFAVAYIPRILAKTVYTFIWSIIAVFLFTSIWNTKD